MELPDRWSDITDLPAAPVSFNAAVPAAPVLNGPTPITRPSLSQAYYRAYYKGTPPSGTFAGAECLYLIIMAALAEEGDAREIFKPDDTADTDNDGFREFVDGWKQPIKFLRWAPGFQTSELQILSQVTASMASPTTATVAGPGLSLDPSLYIGGPLIQFDTTQTGNPFDLSKTARITNFDASSHTLTLTLSPSAPSVPSFSGVCAVLGPDPFDPFTRLAMSVPPTFALQPLIFSAGPDRCYGMTADFDSMTPLRYAIAGVNLNPYYATTDSVSGRVSLIGTARDEPLEPHYVRNGWVDNIHNHLMGLR